ncbi:MAG: hypothetical protein KC613_25420 [Myxococcales bacterium]|nr:hypothetical protein [Myxococcales bacterium]
MPEALAEQPHRRLSQDGIITGGADAVLATAVPRREATVSEWHGYFYLDARANARITPNVDLSVNAVAYQTTASSGYRTLAGVAPGVTGHVYGVLGRPGGRALYGEVMGVDLGERTVGRGLLLERQLWEGGFARLQWSDLHLSLLIAGQTHLAADDLFVTRVGLGRWVELNWLVWPNEAFTRVARHLTLAGEVPALGPSWRLAWEMALRLADGQGSGAGAALLKLDWRPPVRGGATWHLGYQGRIYQQGFTPAGQERVRPITWFVTPQREETLATNSVDYYEMADTFHQWSHTGVVEFRAPLFNPHLRLDVDLEGRAWFFRAVERPPGARGWASVHGRQPLRLAPNPRIEAHGRLALAFLPDPARPDRVRAGLQNTFTPDVSRFGDTGWTSPIWLQRRGWFVFASMEVFL